MIRIAATGLWACAESDWHRVHGKDTPAMWRTVADAFDFGFDYELARARWRLAESLTEHGDRPEAETEWRQAVATAAHREGLTS